MNSDNKLIQIVNAPNYCYNWLLSKNTLLITIDLYLLIFKLKFSHNKRLVNYIKLFVLK